MVSDVTVKFGADIGGLQAGFQSAGQATDSFAAKAEGLRAALAVDGFAPLEANVEKLRTQFSTFGEAVDAIGAQARAGVVSFEDFTPIMGQLRGAFDEAAEGGHGLTMATAGARRELIVLGHEAISGNWTRLGPSMMVLAERMGGLSAPTLGVVAAIAALGYAVVEAARHMDALADASDRVRSALAVSGTNLSSGQIGEFIDQLRGLKDVSTDEASAIVAAFARMRGASASEIQGLITAIDPLAQAMGVKTPAMAHELAGAFADPTTKGHAFLQSIGASADVLARFDQAIASGHQQAGLKAMADAMEGLSLKVADVNPHLIDGLSLLERWNLRLETLAHGLDATAENMARVKFKQDMGEGGAAGAGKMDFSGAQQFVPMQDLRGQADALRDDISKTNAQIASETVAFWERQKALYQQGGQSTVEIDRQIQSARAALIRQTSSDVVAQSEAETQRRIAAGTMGRAEELSIEIEADRRELADARVSAEEKLRISRDEMQKTAQLHAEAASDHLRVLQSTAAATRSGSQERIAAEQAAHDYAVKAWGDYSSQALAAQDKVSAAVRAYQAEQERMARTREETEREVARIGEQTEKDRLDAEVSAGRMTTEQKIQALQRLTDADYEQTLARLDIEDAGLKEGTQAFEEAYRRRAVLAAQYQQDTAKLADQMAQAQRRAAEETAQHWEQAFSPINRGMDAMVQGMVMGTQTMRQAGARAAADFLMEELSADAKWLEHKLITNALGLADDQKSAQGGALAWVWSELTKTSATATGSATRTATSLSGHAVQTAADQTQTAAHIAGEAAKTGATVAGDAARTASSTTASATTGAADSMAASSGIMKHAAAAAAAVYDDVAQIPYVGWILAPVAAGAAFAAVMAYDALVPSFDVGSYELAGDTLATVHAGEMIVPAAQAANLRASGVIGTDFSLRLPSSMTSVGSSAPTAASAPAGGGTANAGGGVNVTFAVQAMDSASVQAFFNANARRLAATISRYSTTSPSSSAPAEL